MTRKELYNEIYSLNLQDEIKNTTGRNFTQVPSNILEDIISVVKEGMKVQKPKNKASNKCSCAVEKLVNILAKKHILLSSEVKEILG